MNSYQRLVHLARAHPDALGLVLSGSRGRGDGRPSSDWDCYLVVADGARLEADVEAAIDDSIDLTTMSLQAFREYGAPGTEAEWDAYAFAHVIIDHDGLDGEIRSIAAAKEFLPMDGARVRPFHRYLSCELERHPLTTLPVSTVRLETLAAAAVSGDAEAAVDLFAVVEATAAATDLTKVIEAWGDEELTLARSS